MKEKGFKKGVKDFVKDIIALIVIAAIGFGGYTLFKNYKSDTAHGDDSYKVETKRNSKYNGVYSLTKLDENGKNTWDGLMLYVKNDKIVSCDNIDYTPMEDIIKQFGDKADQINKEEDILWEANRLGVNIDLPRGGASGVLYTCFSGGSGIGSVRKNDGLLVGKGEFVCKDKVDFDKVTDVKTDYDYMKSCDIVPGYDEKSQEVWLSKLLSNEKSVYHDGYKLIHYNGYYDIQKNCKLDNGSCIRELNEEFNAGLKEF